MIGLRLFPLKSADARGAGTREEPLRTSAWAKIIGHVSHSTELVRMCLACQHFDFNSADWISDNLHVISS